MMTKSTEKPLTIPRGRHRLSAVLHRPRRTRAVVILAHGFTGHKAENARLFVSMARALAEQDIAALRFDFMGSGDSSGEFHEMSPKTEIADLQAVIDWAAARFARIGILGLSFGGAVSICAVSEREGRDVTALCTWSAVPSFRVWRSVPSGCDLDPDNTLRVGKRFFSDRPRRDVPEAYGRLKLPKLQIQGDADLPLFREVFSGYFSCAPEPKRHLVLPGADHVFTRMRDRRVVIAETVVFFDQYLLAAQSTPAARRRLFSA